MSFDPMAAAIDWLDAYRAGDLETLLEMYAEDAAVYCDCYELIVTGRENLRGYWAIHLQEHPAAELDNLQPSHGGAIISYVSGENVVEAVLDFNDAGKIRTLSCRPTRQASPSSCQAGVC
ncbi:nuclear transport factor 2 family protein [Bradyrhizobium arachidis]|uniref:Nuclear transport factor 2 family protein n=1 Tax=Bradyrhizobium arachidis TaxID=858423 RepID=A0AAE7NLK7_9BRAD|nr:nuclear transport factor 2 family protein [Bradyrhizobium arachidis]QOZ67172.1 nuclear transport factor 2 family protein [Bradyrhizobium arachidis]SFV19879.1 SnoaL-like domain-containing protein [Bradyrhizobium arachidis]